MRCHHIPVELSQRYYTSGLAIEQAAHVWICLHGYGYLAQYFGRKFEVISDRVHLIFPEGNHRFYKEGTSGRVGASWMTKEDRLVDIENQKSYLDAVYAASGIEEAQEVTLLGFSQGAATASRWAAATDCRIDRLLLWSGVLPPDMSPMAMEKLDRIPDVRCVYGNEDPFMSKSDFMQHLAQRHGQDYDLIEFSGGHDIPAAVLEKVLLRIGI